MKTKPTVPLPLILLGLVAASFAVPSATVADGDESSPQSLLRQALQQWDRGAAELAFTQETRILERNGSIKQTRVERYDPSQPDPQRWTLLQVDGREPTADEIHNIQDRRNEKPRKQPMKPLGHYLDLATVDIVAEDNETTTFRVLADDGAAFLVDLEQLEVFITVSKRDGEIVNIGAKLRDDMKIAFGIARVTGLVIDVDILDPENAHSGDLKLGNESQASATMRKWGRPYEFTWTDLQRVEGHASRS